MTIGAFWEAIARVRRLHQGKITNGGRAWAFRIGFQHDPHEWDRAADMVYPGGPNRPGAEGHLRSPSSCRVCSGDGLKVIHEKHHDHYQPMDFPAGPVTAYAGETKTWV